MSKEIRLTMEPFMDGFAELTCEHGAEVLFTAVMPAQYFKDKEFIKALCAKILGSKVKKAKLIKFGAW